MEFSYNGIDEEGSQILDVISSANQFNLWMYETISPFCSGNILEIGCGLGNISHYFIQDNRSIFLSDIRPSYLDFCKKTFHLDDAKLLNIDIADVHFNEKYSRLFNTFDSIFCLNVLEHVQDDRVAVNHMTSLLSHHGRLTVLVPAYPFLYNGIDKALQHYKRYTKQTFKELLPERAKATHLFYFNAMGIPAWFWGGKFSKKNTIPRSKMNWYDSFVPYWKIIDRILFSKMGLSLVCVMQKTA